MTFLHGLVQDFYLSLQAKPMEDWIIYRLTGDTLQALAEKNNKEE